MPWTGKEGFFAVFDYKGPELSFFKPFTGLITGCMVRFESGFSKKIT